MIKNPNITSSLRDRSAFHIKDSLLSDGLERNRITKPDRLITPSLEEHPISKSTDERDARAS